MKLTRCKTLLVSLAIISGTTSAKQLAPEGFQNPEKKYLPKTWMHAMNGNLSKPGFTEDFKP